jgi:hypothetical protein
MMTHIRNLKAAITEMIGQWAPAAWLFAGILAHFGLWGYLWHQRRTEEFPPDDPRVTGA